MSDFHSRYIKYLLVAAIQVLATISFSMLFVPVPRDNTIFPGIFINGVEVSGLSRDEAVQRVKAEIDTNSAREIILRYENKQWKYSTDDMGFVIDIPQAVDRALAINSGKTFLSDAVVLLKTKQHKPDISVRVGINQLKIRRILNQIASQVDIKASDARMVFDGGQFKLIPEMEGKKLDINETENRIQHVLKESTDQYVDISIKKVPPNIKADDLEGLDNLLSFGVTVFNRDDKKWAAEVMNAVKAIDGTVIAPGGIFSFNEKIWGKNNATGKDKTAAVQNLTQVRLKSNGSSQVASTLYQAALYGGFSVEKRIPHYIIPAYSGPGFDAVVLNGKADLQFRNTSNSPVYINALIKDNRVIINLLGEKPHNGSFQISSKPDTDGAKYRIINLYRIWYKDGSVIKKESISKDRYAILP